VHCTHLVLGAAPALLLLAFLLRLLRLKPHAARFSDLYTAVHSACTKPADSSQCLLSWLAAPTWYWPQPLHCWSLPAQL
jgi:hypothetical protein